MFYITSKSMSRKISYYIYNHIAALQRQIARYTECCIKWT